MKLEKIEKTYNHSHELHAYIYICIAYLLDLRPMNSIMDLIPSFALHNCILYRDSLTPKNDYTHTILKAKCVYIFSFTEIFPH